MSEWDAVSMCVVKMVSMVIPGIGREFFFFSGLWVFFGYLPFLSFPPVMRASAEGERKDVCIW